MNNMKNAPIDWELWVRNVLADLPASASVGDYETIKNHLEAAVKEIEKV